jgi:hypothetical protein
MTSKKSFYFRGNFNILLQGHKSLALHNIQPNMMAYYLGSKRSRICIRDFRQAARTAALQSLNGKNANQFAEYFGKPAKVKIYRTNNKIHIDLQECAAHQDETLWLGVVRDGEPMPVFPINWEYFRQVNKTKTGFIALVPRSI